MVLMEVKQPKPESQSLKPDSPPPGPATFAFRPQRQPSFWAALAYAIGIVFGHYQSRPASLWIVGCAAFAAASCYFIRRQTNSGRIWLAGSLALGALFLAGAL